MSLGRGCKQPDPHKLAAHPKASAHAAVAGRLQAHRDGVVALPSSADLLPPPAMGPNGEEIDQGPTGSCVWGSLSDAFVGSCQAAGTPLGFVPSQDEGYKETRALERGRDYPSPQTLPDLTDSGSDPEDALFIAAQIGVRPMKVTNAPDGRFYDTWPEIVNDEIDPFDVELAVATKVKVDAKAHTIDPTSADMSDLLAAALCATPHPFVVEACGTVNDAFETNTDTVASLAECDPNGANAGGHAYQIRAFRTNPTTGRREFFLKNSWGRWGVALPQCPTRPNGRWVDELFLGKCWGMWVIDPTVTKEAA